jgi:uncharacterized pyridoxal phosphate-containing UPF0001 family protein
VSIIRRSSQLQQFKNRNKSKTQRDKHPDISKLSNGMAVEYIATVRRGSGGGQEGVRRGSGT